MLFSDFGFLQIVGMTPVSELRCLTTEEETWYREWSSSTCMVYLCAGATFTSAHCIISYSWFNAQCNAIVGGASAIARHCINNKQFHYLHSAKNNVDPHQFGRFRLNTPSVVQRPFFQGRKREMFCFCSRWDICMWPQLRLRHLSILCWNGCCGCLAGNVMTPFTSNPFFIIGWWHIQLHDGSSGQRRRTEEPLCKRCEVSVPEFLRTVLVSLAVQACSCTWFEYKRDHWRFQSCW